ncbi:MAG: HNH endonuclease [Actinobacteria bacterium HGW-Actinobacteria-4]|nr:MAG: HNH endonuclease [Actinobacteria bacterium HGW-Actinobacteria-4]
MSSTATSAPRLARQFATGELVGWGAPEWEALSTDELVSLVQEVAQARRRVDAALAGASAEIARRSTADNGAGDIARRKGFANPKQMIAAVTGGTTAEAGRLISVGRTTLDATAPELRPEDRVPGEPEPLRLVELAGAVTGGFLSIDGANAVGDSLTRLALVLEPGILADAERHLVQRAQDLPLDRLAVVIRQMEAELDPAALALKEEARRRGRYLNIFENRQGVVVVDGRLDPETAAPLKAVIETMVTDVLRGRRDGSGVGMGDSAGVDDRTVPQIRADALATLAGHCLGCEAKDLPPTKTTVVVRVGLAELKSGLGLGEIDGFDQPMSVEAIRRMAADAGVVPMVMGGPSEVLDLGRSRRLFSPAQRMALVERDGGCAHCHAPPIWCQAHHIQWWDRDGGRTDLSNGILLCTTCHQRLHRDGWDISVRGAEVWFVPPADVDRERKPIRGGRERFEYRGMASAAA